MSEEAENVLRRAELDLSGSPVQHRQACMALNDLITRLPDSPQARRASELLGQYQPRLRAAPLPVHLEKLKDELAEISSPRSPRMHELISHGLNTLDLGVLTLIGQRLVELSYSILGRSAVETEYTQKILRDGRVLSKAAQKLLDCPSLTGIIREELHARVVRLLMAEAKINASADNWVEVESLTQRLSDVSENDPDVISLLSELRHARLVSEEIDTFKAQLENAKDSVTTWENNLLRYAGLQSKLQQHNTELNALSSEIELKQQRKKLFRVFADACIEAESIHELNRWAIALSRSGLALEINQESAGAETLEHILERSIARLIQQGLSNCTEADDLRQLLNKDLKLVEADAFLKRLMRPWCQDLEQLLIDWQSLSDADSKYLPNASVQSKRYILPKQMLMLYEAKKRFVELRSAFELNVSIADEVFAELKTLVSHWFPIYRTQFEARAYELELRAQVQQMDISLQQALIAYSWPRLCEQLENTAKFSGNISWRVLNDKSELKSALETLFYSGINCPQEHVAARHWVHSWRDAIKLLEAAESLPSFFTEWLESDKKHRIESLVTYIKTEVEKLDFSLTDSVEQQQVKVRIQEFGCADIKELEEVEQQLGIYRSAWRQLHQPMGSLSAVKEILLKCKEWYFPKQYALLEFQALLVDAEVGASQLLEHYQQRWALLRTIDGDLCERIYALLFQEFWRRSEINQVDKMLLWLKQSQTHGLSIKIRTILELHGSVLDVLRNTGALSEAWVLEFKKALNAYAEQLGCEMQNELLSVIDQALGQEPIKVSKEPEALGLLRVCIHAHMITSGLQMITPFATLNVWQSRLAEELSINSTRLQNINLYDVDAMCHLQNWLNEQSKNFGLIYSIGAQWPVVLSNSPNDDGLKEFADQLGFIKQLSNFCTHLLELRCIRKMPKKYQRIDWSKLLPEKRQRIVSDLEQLVSSQPRIMRSWSPYQQAKSFLDREGSLKEAVFMLGQWLAHSAAYAHERDREGLGQYHILLDEQNSIRDYFASKLNDLELEFATEIRRFIVDALNYIYVEKEYWACKLFGSGYWDEITEGLGKLYDEEIETMAVIAEIEAREPAVLEIKSSNANYREMVKLFPQHMPKGLRNAARYSALLQRGQLPELLNAHVRVFPNWVYKLSTS